MWLLLLCSGVLGVWLYRRHRQMTLMQRLGYKGPKPNFILGNIAALFGDNNIKTIGEWTEEYGNIVAFYVGAVPGLIVMDEELLKAVQIKDFHIFMDRQSYVKGTGHPEKVTQSSILYAEKSRWRELRSILTPTFNAAKLKHMTGIINDAIIEMIENLKKTSENGSKEFDIYEFYQKLTMDVIGRAAFGIRCDAQKSGKHPFIEHSQHILAHKGNYLVALNIFFPEFDFILYPMRVAWLHISEYFRPSSNSFLFNACREILTQRRANKTNRKDLLQAMMDAKMETDQVARTKGSDLTADSNATTTEEVENVNVNSSKKYTTMNDDEIVGSSFIFLEAGFETTSTTLAYITHIFVNHPEVQEKVRAEIQELMSKDGKLDYNSMAALPYTEAVIFETLRLYPPVSYFVNRRSCEDYVHDGRLIPKGTTILVPVPQIHRNPDYWPEPDKFDPMRFYKENKATINPVHYQAFGTGPRNCVGIRFAILETKLALAHLLLNFRLEAGPNTELGDLALKCKPVLVSPLNGVKVKAVPL